MRRWARPRSSVVYRDRAEAGAVLAGALAAYRRAPGGIVLGLPRGGVPVAAEVAAALELPLDVFVVRKLGVPGQEELAFGAVASGGSRVLNHDVVAALGISRETIERVASAAQDAVAERDRVYRGGRPMPDLAGRTVILVDDGLATGASMRAAVMAVRALGPEKLVVAVPVGARPTCRALGAGTRGGADEVICVEMPEPFSAVGLWYDDFSEVSDADVTSRLRMYGEGVGKDRGT